MYDGSVRTARLVIGPSSVEEPCTVCGLFRGVRKGSNCCTAILDFQGYVPEVLVFSTIAASSEWHQGQTKGKRHGWLRDHGCKRRVGTVRNIQHISLDELNDLGF